MMAKNPVSTQRTKHIDVRYHHICESVAARKIELKYLQTSEQVADIFTKALQRILFEKQRGHLLSPRGRVKLMEAMKAEVAESKS